VTDQVWEEVRTKVLNEAMGLNGQIRLKEVGKATAEKYLRTLYTKTWKLKKYLDEIPSEAWLALPPGTDLNTIKFDLAHKLCQPASKAIKNLRDDPDDGRRGRHPLDWRAKYLMQVAVEAYETATGKPATSKKLTSLLEEPFHILKLGSPSNCVLKYTRK
jgi:hypothetical protein